MVARGRGFVECLIKRLIRLVIWRGMCILTEYAAGLGKIWWPDALSAARSAIEERNETVTLEREIATKPPRQSKILNGFKHNSLFRPLSKKQKRPNEPTALLTCRRNSIPKSAQLCHARGRSCRSIWFILNSS